MRLLTQVLILLMLCTGLSGLIVAQTPGMNYIQTFDVVKEEHNAANLVNGVSTKTALQTIQYFDGLGRAIQTVRKAYTPEGKDFVYPTTYNAVGLDEINYEPYGDGITNGEYKTNFESEEIYFYTYKMQFVDGNGRSPIEYEKSPLNRILKQGAPGAPWQLEATGDEQPHPIKYEYLSNNNTDLCARLWNVAANLCSSTGNYGNNQLYVTKTTNEDNAETYEFKDKQGQVVLKRSVLSATENIDTYYVYDDFGLLRFVISPEGSDQISGSFTAATPLARKYVYCYKYDARKRLIEKQVPGKEPEYYIYDKTDKVVFFQDGNMRNLDVSTNTKWLFTKYDALGRVIITGIKVFDDGPSREALQNWANSNTFKCWEYISYAGAVPALNNNYYSNQSFPIIENTDKILTVNYYDGYTVCNSASTPPVSIANNTELEFIMAPEILSDYNPDLKAVAGKPTVSFVECNGNQLAEAIYYDRYGRTIQTASEHHLRGYDRFTTLYKGLTANVENMFHSHYSYKKPDQTFTYTRSEEYNYTYDDAGRQKDMEYIYNGHTLKHITHNEYDELGRLKSKQVGEGTYLLQNLNYAYNIRGWLTKINDPYTMAQDGDLFAMQLGYNKPIGIGTTPAFNGNITGAIWQTVAPYGVNQTGITGLKGYKYKYDKLNRLLAGQYTEFDGTHWDASEKYTEQIVQFVGDEAQTAYDKNGNIKWLSRKGLLYPNNAVGFIDKLSYTYNGNQLVGVDDDVNTNNYGDFYENGHKYGGIAEYKYDYNGNLITDANRGINEIIYNELNLPVSIAAKEYVTYLYDAVGTKREQVYFSKTQDIEKTTDFIGNFVYENGVPAYNVYDEGRIVYNSDGTYFGEAFIKDHLGNVRVTYRLDNGVLKTRQADSYYPFGMSIKGLTSNGSNLTRPNEYLYNGKMMQDEMGLGWLDYGARFYDAVTSRWISPDPLAEKYPSLSPYAYCANNPIVFIDPDGKKIIFVNGYLGFGSPEGGAKYWNGEKGTFVSGAKQYFGDQDKPYFTNVDYRLSSTAEGRRSDGYEWAKTNFATLTEGMSKDKDVFRMVAHSMGAAYGEGMSDYIKEQGWQVAQKVDINAFQAGDIKANTEHPCDANPANCGVGIFVVDYQNTDDPVINNPVRSSPGDIENATVNIRVPSGEKNTLNIHRNPIDNGTFWKNLYDQISKELLK